jgi:hypothetical protein
MLPVAERLVLVWMAMAWRFLGQFLTTPLITVDEILVSLRRLLLILEIP